jgi:sugar/nucleoside kinase (ribokinase family)
LQGVRNVLVKLGGKGAVLVPQDGPPLIQHAIQPPVMVDTTGASDAFTAAYAVALIERQSPSGALRFAGILFPYLLLAFVLFRLGVVMDYPGMSGNWILVQISQYSGYLTNSSW